MNSSKKTFREYSEQEAAEIAGYMDLYHQVQRFGMLVKIYSGIRDVDESSLLKTAIQLRKTLTEFQNTVPREIQEKLTKGVRIGELESLATNTLIRPLDEKISHVKEKYLTPFEIIPTKRLEDYAKKLGGKFIP